MIFATACHRTSQLDDQLIGSWECQVCGGDSLSVITYEGDHTFSGFIWSRTKSRIDSTGTWRVDGYDVVFDAEYPAQYLDAAESRDLPILRQKFESYRETIMKLGHDALELKSGAIYKRMKTPPKPSNQSLQPTTGRSDV